ncbi:uncharacterized protein PV09_04194 [Verruconis gallopava]|uniref:N-acetyltransferase domain-containing protein n=1 Tax=Verruconis gallopava TaxID=253628 RepID=A0A0D2ADJ5_9PEZI|nr:uncharacterized protein PV09_04194 [Verruconis gallopava]KIW05038.1 hypothetical protein PV09_04194 [Verruconis gallopava]
MATQFVSFQPPPGASLRDYDRSLPPSRQPASVPPVFVEAMQVREEVFVKEQGVPLANELDEDDPRSFHWVVYASVGSTSSASPTTMGPINSGSASDERRRSESTATKVPVGTIRLVPPPHPPHVVEGGAHLEEPREPYVKLGRLATLSAYRGLGLSRLLINAAINWAKEHADDILPRPSPAQVEAAKQEGRPEWMPWRGLILVHAQVQVQKLWEGFGFVKDESMGTWVEEGIDHVGLWRKVEVKGDGPKTSLT